MLKMPRTSHYHGHVVFITKVNTQLVLDGTYRLDNTCDTRLVRNFNAVRKGEECVTSHCSPF